MKPVLLCIALCCCIAIPVSAQKDSLTLKDLEIPGSPGFMLLDKAPTAIDRPNSSKAFALSVLNAFNENNGIPKNYAVELTPFWFFKHPNMTSLKYAGYNKLKNRQMAFCNLKRASVSAAFITTTDTVLKLPVANLSLGFRTNIIAVRHKHDIEDLKKANARLIEKLKDQQDRLVKYLGENGLMLSVLNPTLYDQKVREFFEEEEKRNTKEKNEIAGILKRRAAFAVDGAFGYNTFFLNNNFSSHHFGRMGAWLTVNYSQPLNQKAGSYINVYAIGRYLSDGTTMDQNKYVTKNFTDVGGKLEFEFKQVSFSYEYIYRSNAGMNTFRSSGLLKYKLSDNLFLTGAFGRNFGTDNNLIALMGINWGLSSGTEQPKVSKD